MLIGETIIVTVGNSIAKSLLKFWLQDEALAQDVGLSIADLAEAKAKTFVERRSIERSFGKIAEQVASKLSPFIETEFQSTPSNEVEAAILAAQGTIDGLKLDESLLLSTDLEPIRLESILRDSDPDAVKDKLLSERGAGIYDYTIREAAHYIVEVVLTLPGFDSKAAREMLVRESKLTDLVEKILEKMPEDSGFGSAGDPDRFEAQYRREVALKLDRLELFGVTTEQMDERYALSVAYIGLTASTKATPQDKPEGKADNDDADSDERVELTVKDLVTRGPRNLIRGEAGSGKTTLLQWLAVTSARRDFDEELEEWNDTVPFFIQLRRHVSGKLPRPSEFPASIGSALLDEMPDGWVNQQLGEGRGLVLVDGVDELREEERKDAVEWLRDLIRRYPDSRYVVTSRPPAVSENWLADQGFVSAFLEQMDLSSVDSFIEHWHEAAQGAALDEAAANDLANLSDRLKSLIREAPQLRNLATSPLLCAMLCALNRDRRSQLPHDRIDLYRIALEMLLERRDIARKLPENDLRLSRQQKEMLLQQMAYWLLCNGFTDAPKSVIVENLAKTVEALPKTEASSATVVDFLLERSGLIREPVGDRIDFIHRTFLEYLSAKQAVEDRSTGLLVENAHRDQWQEVVVLAAGLAPTDVSRRLIGELLDRSKADAKNRHRLQLLAVACLETTPLLPRETQEEIEAVLVGLIPPRSMSEARAIASAGEVAAPLLADHHNDVVATAAPSARALGLIGGDTAMAMLERFGPDNRVTIARELLRSWDFFPTDQYAERVLKHSVLDYGHLEINTAEKLHAVRHLEYLSRLVCVGGPHRGTLDWDWSSLAQVSGLSALILRYLDGLTDLPPLADGGRYLTLLRVFRCPSLVDLNLDGMEHLSTLMLTNNPELTRVHNVEALDSLRNLTITASKNLECDFRLPSSCRSMTLSELLKLTDLGLAEDADLQTVTVRNCPSLSDVSALWTKGELASISLRSCNPDLNLSGLFELPNLTNFSLTKSNYDGFEELALAAGLELLVLGRTNIADLRPLSGLSKLESLGLDYSDHLEDIVPLAGLSKLNSLSLAGCLRVTDLEPLSALTDITTLDLEMCRSVTSLKPLESLPNLQHVDARGCGPGIDPAPLRDRGVTVLTGQPIMARFKARPA
jgi:hypothetical protein